MIKIEINDLAVETKNGISSKTGKPFSIREQTGWGFFYDQQGKPHPHPMRVRLTLDDQQAPYPVGIYMLAPESLYPDRFGQITIRAKLKPAVAAAAKAA